MNDATINDTITNDATKEEAELRRPANAPKTKTRKEEDLLPHERDRLAAARKKAGRKFRSHSDCVADYLKYCDLLVELGLKPAEYTPSVNRVQQATGIPCWRTVKRCMEKAQAIKPPPP